MFYEISTQPAQADAAPLLSFTVPPETQTPDHVLLGLCPGPARGHRPQESSSRPSFALLQAASGRCSSDKHHRALQNKAGLLTALLMKTGPELECAAGAPVPPTPTQQPQSGSSSPAVTTPAWEDARAWEGAAQARLGEQHRQCLCRVFSHRSAQTFERNKF